MTEFLVKFALRREFLGGNVEYLRILILSMIPVTELRGAIPIGIALDLNPIGVYIASVIGSTLVSVPLVLTYRHIVQFMRDKKIFIKLLNKIDHKIENSMKKMKAASLVGIILFVGIPLPGTGAWTGCLIAAVLEMNKKKSFIAIMLGIIMASIIMMLLSYGIIGNLLK